MVNLKRQFEGIREEIMRSLAEVLESSRYVLGPKVTEFEDKVAEYCGAQAAFGVASGTDALHIAIKSLGIGKGDEVITTPFSFFSTVESILYEGATPVFVDVDLDTFNIDVEKIEERITDRTRAILPVHMFGLPVRMDEVMHIADKHGLKVIEDCAQAFGASIDGGKVGSFGDAGCFSFYPSKNLGAVGDGGMITLRDSGFSDVVRKMRNHGSSGSYVHELIGFNSRLDEIQAAILLVKLKRVDEYNLRRRERARLYTKLLSSSVKCPSGEQGFFHVYHQYTILSPKRDEIRKKLKEADIASMIYYPIPLHLQKPLEFLGYGKGDFKSAEKAAEEVLSIPMCPEIENSDIERIAEIVLSV
jgi:dTDP-4-amino-4,6-dideoxygalactose transaminase